MAAARVDNRHLQIDDVGDRLAWHDLPYARYGFCRACGSTLFFRAADTPDRTSVMVGVLDDVSDLRLGGVWFADDAQAHHELPGHVPHFSGNDG